MTAPTKMEGANSTLNITSAMTQTTISGILASTKSPDDLWDCNLPPGECDKVRIEKQVIVAITIAVVLFTIACIIILGKYKNFLERIICHLLVANLLSAIFIIDSDGKPEDEGTVLCVIQGFSIQLFDFAECVWCFNFTIYLFVLMVKEKDTSCYERYYVIGAWGSSIIISCLPFIKKDAYGPASAPFCWIIEKYSATWRFAVYWIPVSILLGLMLIAFIYMICRAYRQLKQYRNGPDQNDERYQKMEILVQDYLKPLTAYFTVFFLISMIQVAYRIQNAVEDPNLVFVYFHMASISSFGIALSLLFFVLSKRELTKENFRRGLTEISIKIRTCGRRSQSCGEKTVLVRNRTVICHSALEQASELRCKAPNRHSGEITLMTSLTNMEDVEFPLNFTSAMSGPSTSDMLPFTEGLDKLGDCNLPPGDCDKVRLVKNVILAVTIAVILFTIACIIILGKYKNFLERIICHLLLANLLSAISIIVGDGRPEDEGTPWCVAQAFLIQMLDFAECLWCCNFTIYLFVLMVKDKDTSCYERYYVIGAWGISTIIACLPFIKRDAYGPASAPFCWIIEKYSATWRFAVYWIPVSILLVLMLIAFIYMICRTHQQLKKYQSGPDQNNERNERMKTLVQDYLKPLTAYFALFFFISMIQVANRIQNAFQDPVLVFVMLHMASISSFGIALSLLFFVLSKKELTKENFHRGLTDISIKIKTCGRRKKKPDPTYTVTQGPMSIADGYDNPTNLKEITSE